MTELRVVEERLSIWSVRASRTAGDVAALLSQCAQVEPRAWLAIDREPPRADGLQVVDVSARYAAFLISGNAAPDLFAAALSLPAQSLKPGCCACTRFAEECEVFIQRLGEAEYRLLIDAPLAHFAAQWIRDFAA